MIIQIACSCNGRLRVRLSRGMLFIRSVTDKSEIVFPEEPMADQTIPQTLRRMATDYPDIAAQMSRVDGGAFQPRTYRTLYHDVQALALGLQALGVERGGHVGLVSENRVEWFVTDLAVLSLGAADVPRGNDSTAGELEFILGIPRCRVVVVENEAQLAKILSVGKALTELKHLVLIEGEIDAKPIRGVKGPPLY